MSKEKERRMYYQKIVYYICSILDDINGNKPGNGIVCGTVEHPSTDVQERIEKLAKEIKRQRKPAFEYAGEECCGVCKKWNGSMCGYFTKDTGYDHKCGT